MKSEEKLNHLFEVLKAEKASTSLADVTSWIQSSAQVTASKSTSKIIIQKNFLIMSTILSTLLVGGLLFLSGNKEPKRTPSENNTKKKSILDTSTSIVKQAKPLPVNKGFSEKLVIQPLINLGIEPLPFMEIDNGLAINQLDPIRSTQHSPRVNNQSNAGSWLSSNGALHVDTLFSGVKKVVFRGNYNSKVRIEGSKQQDVSFNFLYERKAKGLIKNKRTQYKVSYEIVDSVLTILGSESSGIDVVVGYLSVKDSVKLVIPENIPIDIQTDYGDISVSSLKESSIQLNTTYGDLSVKNCSGVMSLKSDYGDFTLTELSGKIDAKTNYGDVKGEKITAKEYCALSTDYGDVKVHLLNPIQECAFDLKTEFGSIKSKREDFSIKGNQFKFGTGSQKISLKTNFGDVIIR